MVGGMVSEGRQCRWAPCRMLASRPCVGVPLVVYPVALLNGGVVCVVLPRVRIGSGTLYCATPLHIVRSPRIVPVPLLSCVAVFVVGGEVRWCVQYCFRVAAAVLCCVALPCCGGVWSHCERCILFLLPSVFVFAVTALLV